MTELTIAIIIAVPVAIFVARYVVTPLVRERKHL